MDPHPALAALNPWWATEAVPPALQGRPRLLTADLVTALPLPEVLALSGIRRCGKTTILYQLVQSLIDGGAQPERVLFANLEDPALTGVTLDDIVSAHRQRVHPDGPTHILLDEVQARSGWEAWVNALYERRTGVKMVVTGSASSLLEGDLARLLTGRDLTFRVNPLSFREYLEFHDVAPPAAHATHADRDAAVHHVDRYLALGGFPEASLRDPALARNLLQHYFRDIVHRDLVDRHALDAARVQDLAVYLAASFARPHTGQALARAVGVAPDTVRGHMERLEEVFLILTVRRFTWSPKPGPAAQGPFKVYLADTGLRNAVAPDHMKDLGRLAENLVATTLVSRGPRPSYWTDGKGRHEVDFVVARPGGAVEAYQVTYGADVPDREEAALQALRETLPRGRGCTLRILTRTVEESREGVELIPLWKWLLTPTPPPGPIP